MTTSIALRNDPAGVTAPVLGFVEALKDDAVLRLERWRSAAGGWTAFRDNFADSSFGPWGTVVCLVLVAITAALFTAGVTRTVTRRLSRPGIAVQATIGLVIFVTGLLAIVIAIQDTRMRAGAADWFAIGILAALICVPLSTRGVSCIRPNPSILGFRRALARAIFVGLLGSGILAWLRNWEANEALRDLVATFALSLPFTALLLVAYLGHRTGVTLAISRSQPQPSGARGHFVRLWPIVAAAIAGFAFVVGQLLLTIGHPTRPAAFLLTLLLLLATPHIDAMIAMRGQATQFDSILRVSAWRTARWATLILTIVLLGAVWLSPVLSTTEGSSLHLPLILAGLVLLLGIGFLWNVLGVLGDRGRPRRGDLDAEMGGLDPVGRLASVGPLVVNFLRAILVALGSLSVLAMAGVNIWPLLTGFSIFGLAIGFGSQALVKDVVSGLFFLIDDAFRLGEYIETGHAKGTVERISLRSLSLRHPRGPITTLPYGQIGQIQNFSRDWVIEKLVFRVAFDTDVEVVRKLFKRVGAEIAADPELTPDLLEPFKSQGIAAVEDGTLVIRGKFKARAGRQFQIRKAVLAAVQKGFRDNGVVVVGRPLNLPA
jgi:small-conductance mechanosensitive channel